jgi:hypothetical protein
MSLQVFSREYLQSIPEQRKQSQIDGIVSQFRQQLIDAAGQGKTSYMYNRSDTRGHSHCHPSSPALTDAEIIAGFFTRFPGCKIYYEEAWVESGRDTKTLKKGIVIDWS